jgi:hypothetical protein
MLQSILYEIVLKWTAFGPGMHWQAGSKLQHELVLNAWFYIGFESCISGDNIHTEFLTFLQGDVSIDTT